MRHTLYLTHILSKLPWITTMLLTPNQVDSRLEQHQWDPGAEFPTFYLPLDEQTAYSHLDSYFERLADHRSFGDRVGIKDAELVEDLIEAGFTLANLKALHLAPIAFVAWASEVVTDEECRAAVWSFNENRLFEHPLAVSLMQSWLDTRPNQSLWDLWVRYTEYHLDKTPSVARVAIGKQLLEQSTSVALASGGWLGMGKICSAERAVLDEIRRVYRLISR